MNGQSLAARVAGRTLLLSERGTAQLVEQIRASHLRTTTRRAGLLSRLSSLVTPEAGEDDDEDERPKAWVAPYMADRAQVRESGLVVADGVGVIDINGPLLDRAIVFWGYVWMDGYDRIEAALIEAENDPAVRTVMLRMNTPGGMVAGVEGCSRAIRRVSDGGKPVVAYVGTWAMSAGYWLAAACDAIVAPPDGEVGSIGVVIVHIEVSKMLEELGYTVTPVIFGDKKVDGAWFAALSDRARADMQAVVDDLGGKFCAWIAERRSLSEDIVKGFEAGTFMAADGLKAGLVDEIAFEDELFAALAA